MLTVKQVREAIVDLPDDGEVSLNVMGLTGAMLEAHEAPITGPMPHAEAKLEAFRVFRDGLRIDIEIDTVQDEENEDNNE